MFVELVESKKTQVPFEYYELPVCPAPLRQGKRARKNLGSKLQGHNVKPAPYDIATLENKGCTPLCMVKITSRKLKWMRKLVERQYRIHLTLDSLPILMRSQELNYAVRGYPVGFKAPPSYTGKDTDEYFLYNHLRFTILYRVEGANEHRVIGFDVHPVSITHELTSSQVGSETKLATCDAEGADVVVNDPAHYLPLQPQMNSDSRDVFYSYEVKWVQTDTQWTDRWDVYLVGSPDDEVHVFVIINSLMIVLFLAIGVSIIMLRTLKKDISAYNQVALSEDGLEESGWKLVHGDVFRAPKTNPILLSALVGTGLQIGIAIFITLCFALMGFINHMKKGQTLTTIILLYVCSGSVAGYISSRLYKYFDGKAWKRATLLTACLFPGTLVAMFLGLDIFLSFAGAATAVSIWTIISLFLLWVLVSTPLVFVGSFFGFRAPKIEVPTKTNQIARFIPEGPWYTLPHYTILFGGSLPFGCVSIECLFIMGAIWLHQIYYAVGLLVFIVIILAATCAEVALVLNYLQLSAEDHQWWWRSFFNTASAGAYLFVYSLWFLASKLQLVGFLPTLVYLTYMSMMSIAFGLFCGSVGFLSCLVFNRTIFGALKVD